MISPSLPQNEMLQVITAIFIISTIVFEILHAVDQINNRHRSNMQYIHNDYTIMNIIAWTLPMIVLLLHAFTFYSFIELDRYSLLPFDATYTLWSAWLRFHTFATLCGYSFTRWRLGRLL